MDQVILPEHVENDTALGAMIPFTGLGKSPLRDTTVEDNSAQTSSMLLGLQAIDLAKSRIKPPSEIADWLDKAHSTPADCVAMAEKVLSRGTAQPDAPPASKVPEDVQDSNPAKSRVIDPTKITAQLDQIYQSLSQCVVQSHKVLQPDSRWNNIPRLGSP